MSQRIAHVRAVQLRLGRACAAELRGRWLASEHFGLQHGALEGPGLRHWEPGPSGSLGGGQVRQAPPKQQQPGPKSGSLIHVVLMQNRGIGSAGVALMFGLSPGPRQHRNTANRRRRAQDPTTTTTTTRRRAQPRHAPTLRGGGVGGDPSNGWLPISVRVVWGGGGGCVNKPGSI